MKILFTRFPLESRLGGAEIQTLSLMRGLLDDGHAVGFVGSCPTLLDLCAEHDIINGELELGFPPVTPWLALSFLWRKSAMRRKLRDAIAQFGNLGAVVMLSLTEKLLLTEELHRAGVRVLWVEHDRVGRWLTRNPWLGLLKRQSVFATTVTVSDLSRRLYTNLGFAPDRVVAIPNGIDAYRFADVHPPAAGETLRLGCVARLTRDKGVDLLLDAVDGLPHVSLAIVGDGPEASRLRARAERIGPRVTIAPSADIAVLYGGIDALVLPSREHDPFGMAPAEAMLTGLPVIVTDACGIVDYLRNELDALIVPAGSSAALAQAISSLADPARRASLGASAKKTAESRFGLRTMITAYEQLLGA